MIAALTSSARTALRANVKPVARTLNLRLTAVRFASSTSRTLSHLPDDTDMIPRTAATRYSTDHEYVHFDDATNIGTVGITDYAQKALGDVVFVELPQVDSEVTQAGTLRSLLSLVIPVFFFSPPCSCEETC